jgi:outer membrane lipoprotein-sorting protein
LKYLLALLISVSSLGLAQTNAEEVIDAVLNNQRGGESGRSTITMTVIKPGKETVLVIASLSDGSERQLIQVLEPARDAGQAFLIVEDNLWIYNPRLKRTLRLPPSGRSDSFLGSDISYNDLGGRDLASDYQASLSEETEEQITLELIPDALAPTPYGKVVIKVRPADYAPIEYVYYDQREQAVRRIGFDNYTEVNGLPFPTYLVVENLLREGERTIVEISDYEFGIELDESCFSQQALERGCNLN